MNLSYPQTPGQIYKAHESLFSGRKSNALLILQKVRQPDAVKLFQRGLDDLSRQVAEARTLYSKIMTDPNLSDDGKQSQMAMPALRLKIGFDDAQSEINSLDALIEATAATMAFKAPDNPLLQQMIDAEHRQQLAAVPDLELMTRYNEAIRNGNYTEEVRVLNSSPMPRKFVTKESIGLSEQARTRAEFPEASARIEEIQQLRNELQSYVGSLQAMV